MDFYFDESGHTGGLSENAFKSSFGNQRIFTLAAIGASEPEIHSKLIPLLQRFNIKANELKASKIFAKKPSFFTSLFAFIKDEGLPVFVEAVDKKYMLTANLVNCLVLLGYCFEVETRESTYIRNVFSDYLFYALSDEIYLCFLGLCEEPSSDKFAVFFEKIICALKSNKNEISLAIIENIERTQHDFENADFDGGSALDGFLPIPDESKRGKSVWMLPNLSSFTNIYARLNLYMKGDLSSVKIYHDEQLQYDHILDKAKQDVEKFNHDRFGFVSDSADYRFKERAKLFFKASHDSVGVQVADMLAGFVRRYIDQTLNNGSLNNALVDAYKIFMSMNRQESGVGLNMVLSSKDSDRINRF